MALSADSTTCFTRPAPPQYIMMTAPLLATSPVPPPYSGAPAAETRSTCNGPFGSPANPILATDEPILEPVSAEGPSNGLGAFVSELLAAATSSPVAAK